MDYAEIRCKYDRIGLLCCFGCRLSLGDWNEPCVLGEIAWPLVYGIAVDQLGVDHVHRHVGVEEYAKYESLFTLSKQGNNTERTSTSRVRSVC